MKDHDDLVAVLQVGTHRASVPRGDMLPDLQDVDSEKRVLILAGAMDLMARAGANPLNGVGRIPVAPDEVQKVAIRSAEALSVALGGGVVAAVLEWAQKAASLGRIAPPSTLVALVDLAQKHPEQVGPVLGRRGVWLADLRSIELRRSADRDLVARRSADPDSYRDWLAVEFDSMDWKDRAEAIGAMRHGLSLRDEPLLERALADRRKEVRDPACVLLTSLSGSSVAKSLSALANPILAFEKSILRKNLTAQPPEPDLLPKWLPRTASRPNFGAKALALFDVVRFVPPSRWDLGIPAEQMLDLATKTEFSQALIYGWQEAAVRFEDQPWIDALFGFLFSREVLRQEWWSQIVRRANEAVFDRIVSAKFEGLGSEPQTALWALSTRERQLSPGLSRAVVSAFRSHPHHHYALRELAPYLHPRCLHLFSVPYADQPGLESTREHVSRILEIRTRLLESLEPIS